MLLKFFHSSLFNPNSDDYRGQAENSIPKLFSDASCALKVKFCNHVITALNYTPTYMTTSLILDHILYLLPPK